MFKKTKILFFSESYDKRKAVNVIYLMCNILWYRYLIKDLNGQRQYLLDVTLTVCFSDSPSCEIRNKILQHYLVTKPVCAWYTGFSNPGICNLHWCINLHCWWIVIWNNITIKIPIQRKTCHLNLLFLSSCICLTSSSRFLFCILVECQQHNYTNIWIIKWSVLT